MDDEFSVVYRCDECSELCNDKKGSVCFLNKEKNSWRVVCSDCLSRLEEVLHEYDKYSDMSFDTFVVQTFRYLDHVKNSIFRNLSSEEQFFLSYKVVYRGEKPLV